MSFSPNFERWEPEAESVYVSYGRVHAPDGMTDLEWQGERCVTWHNIASPEFQWFLEGVSVQEAAEHERRHSQLPEEERTLRSKYPTRAAFEATEPGRNLRGIEWSAAYAGFKWDYYGERLFSLFDLRQPERWQALRRFIREYYETVRPSLLEGYLKDWGIPPWNVC